MRKIVSLFLFLFCVAVNAQILSIKDIKRERVLIDNSFDKQPDKAVQDFIKPYKERVDSLTSPILGQAARYLWKDSIESPLGNLMADMLVWGANRMGEKIDFAVYNQGGIRATIAKGDITVGDIISLTPFENKLCCLTLTGEEVMELFCNIAEGSSVCLSRSVRVIVQRKPVPQVISATIDGKPINPKKKYRIATLDYLVEGNDGMTAFKKAQKVSSPDNFTNNVLFITMDYIKEQGVIDGMVEGRLTIVNNDPPKRDINLLILHSNDSHSQIDPMSPLLDDKMKADHGGYLRRAAMIRDERLKNPNLLLFDSGDFSQGSPYYSLFKGDVEIGLMNQMKYDAATIGNHEFDYGLENMARLFLQADFPVVCANYDFTGTPCQGIVKPYTVIEREGIRIGVFGLSPKLEGLVYQELYRGVKYLDPVTMANEVVVKLRTEERCDMVICLSHLGWEDDLALSEKGDRWLIENTRGIDLVLGGHSHTYMEHAQYVKDLDGKDVMIDQNGKHSIYVGRIEVELSKK